MSMEAADFFMGGYFGGSGDFSPEKISEHKTVENFMVDDLFNFSNDDAIMSDGFPDNVAGNSSDSSTITSNSGSEKHFYPGNFGQNSQFSGELCVPVIFH